jgi:hypothetical protein
MILAKMGKCHLYDITNNHRRTHYDQKIIVLEKENKALKMVNEIVKKCYMLSTTGSVLVSLKRRAILE